MPKNLHKHSQCQLFISGGSGGGRQYRVSKDLRKAAQQSIATGDRTGFVTTATASSFTYCRFPLTLPEANPFVNGSRYQHSLCTVLDREIYSTLHTCRTKILPCQEDGMIVVLGVVGVTALLRVCPSTHLLEAARWIAALDQAN